MKDLKCPVCGKNGIPDFHEEDVVCPCCGSDLSIYHKLSDLSGINRGKSVRNKSCKYLTFFAGILGTFIGGTQTFICTGFIGIVVAIVQACGGDVSFLEPYILNGLFLPCILMAV